LFVMVQISTMLHLRHAVFSTFNGTIKVR
jgi:hypothetical protein